jgi:hypothetical protein
MTITDEYANTKTMKIIAEYVNRKSIQKKIDSVSPEQYAGLRQLVANHGDFVFHKLRSPLSDLEIYHTIPVMIKNGIHDYVTNLAAIHSVVIDTLEHYTLMYGDNAQQAWEERNNQLIRSEETYISKYGSRDGKIVWDYLEQKKSELNTLEDYREHFGEEAGLEKYNEIAEELAETRRYATTEEYYIEKFGWHIGTRIKFV